MAADEIAAPARAIERQSLRSCLQLRIRPVPPVGRIQGRAGGGGSDIATVAGRQRIRQCVFVHVFDAGVDGDWRIRSHTEKRPGYGLVDPLASKGRDRRVPRISRPLSGPYGTAHQHRHELTVCRIEALLFQAPSLDGRTFAASPRGLHVFHHVAST